VYCAVHEADGEQVSPRAADVQLAQIAAVVGISALELQRGRRQMDHLAGSLRRAVLNRLAAQPQPAGAQLANELGAKPADLSYRLSCLLRDGMVQADSSGAFRVDPRPLLAARQYLDLLLTASAWSSGSSPHEL
jgi:hypothetical protein